MKPIVLTTLNARYSHASIALRYLLANLKELQDDALIREFVINENAQTIAEKILEHEPRIVGIGVYIWNAADVHDLIEVIKKVSPSTTVVLGGPEASHTPFRVNFDAADFIVQGEGEIAFYELCKAVLEGRAPQERIIRAQAVDLGKIALPYAYYSDDDVSHRHIYVEASRGCPYLCEFCLSSLDEKMRYFDIDILLQEFETLWKRGVRSFKFIDRTFNLNIRFANRLLDFFLAKEPPYFAHFEVIPDHFPESLLERIAQFPPASLQLEIGIQTLNPAVAKNINRPLKIEKIKRNIAYLDKKTQAHMHLDLIVGLPGEDLQSFGRNLDELCALTRSEIQIGILKKLSGTTLSRHDIRHGMVYSDKPPYDVLKTADVSFEEIQKMKRFARFWDLTYNSGNFNNSVRMLFDDGRVFEGFFAFSEWIYTQTRSTWKISLERLCKLLFDYLTEVRGFAPENVAETMSEEMMNVNGRNIPPFLRKYTAAVPKPDAKTSSKAHKRQIRHT
jgi:radical SAM superfamily enzyme YgiQ (UPF0313 family)